MDFIRYHVVHVTVVILYLTVLWPLLMLAEYLGQEAGFHWAVPAVKVLIGAWLIVSLWMSYQTSKKVLFEDMTLRKATIASVNDTRGYLAFLPIVGRLFKTRVTCHPVGDVE